MNESDLSALKSDIAPACVFLPDSEEEVSMFFATITSCDNIKYATRSAVQVPLSGAAGLEDGITLGLRNLTGVELKHGILPIGAGER